MEIMLIAVVSPVIRCEWQLENWQVALVTTVSTCCLGFPSRTLRAKRQPQPHPKRGVLASKAHGLPDPTVVSVQRLSLFLFSGE